MKFIASQSQNDVRLIELAKKLTLESGTLVRTFLCAEGALGAVYVDRRWSEKITHFALWFDHTRWFYPEEFGNLACFVMIQSEEMVGVVLPRWVCNEFSLREFARTYLRPINGAGQASRKIFWYPSRNNQEYRE